MTVRVVPEFDEPPRRGYRRKQRRRDPADRFWSKVAKLPSGCWEWRAHTNQFGYGFFWLEPHMVPAHRFSYEQVNGPVPSGLELDHLCRNRACVNPLHLEAVDHRTNVLRGASLQAENARKTRCPYGHEFSPRPSGGRICRTCSRAAAMRQRARKKAA